jgi:hypothetical protein
MPYDVFISHSSEDKTIVDAVCATLESRGLRCWVAPRDILPGMDWDEAILDAISDCRLMLLIFSSHANKSVQIKHEIERALHKGIPILPFRIEEVLPSKSLEYFLSTTHWLDALTPPLEQHLDRLAENIRLLLSHLGGPKDDFTGRESVVSPIHQKTDSESVCSFCIYCGTRLDPEFVYCTRCGRRIRK